MNLRDLIGGGRLAAGLGGVKRDRDDTDFRKVVESYRHWEAGCAFCEVGAERVLLENELPFAVADSYPVTPGHALAAVSLHRRRSRNNPSPSPDVADEQGEGASAE
jgi:hypothetical protein